MSEYINENIDVSQGVQEVVRALDLSLPFLVVDGNGCITNEAISTLGDLAGVIFNLGSKRAQGFSCNREIGKLRKRLSTLNLQLISESENESAVVNHWSGRNRKAMDKRVKRLTAPTSMSTCSSPLDVIKNLSGTIFVGKGRYSSSKR